MGVEIADTSPYLYLATLFFVLSAISSDLLWIRISLTFGFLFLVLASLSGYTPNGSFGDDDNNSIPLSDGIIDIPMFVNAILFTLNLFICYRLVQDERCHRKGALNEEEMALFRYFHSRCGLTQLQFHEILKHGKFLELSANVDIPNCQNTLYLVLEGKVTCHVKMKENQTTTKSFVVRSGEFFDIKMFNLFSIPVGFDNVMFEARTLTDVKLFGWNVYGLIAMRQMNSPCLRPYWEYIVLRSLTQVAIKRHLNPGKGDTLYDSLLVPEHTDWLDGKPSRDFTKQEKPVGNWQHAQRQWQMIKSSIWHIVPPRGIRQRPCILETNPKQGYFELVCKATYNDNNNCNESSSSNFRFLQQPQPDDSNKNDEQSALPPPTVRSGFCLPRHNKKTINDQHNNKAANVEKAQSPTSGATNTDDNKSPC